MHKKRQHNKYAYQIESQDYSDIIDMHDTLMHLYVKFEVSMMNGIVSVNTHRERTKQIWLPN